MSYESEIMALQAEARRSRRAAWLMPMIVTLAIAIGLIAYTNSRPPLTLGPCVMLGLATTSTLEGPHLVIDCDGVQFGVKAAMP